MVKDIYAIYESYITKESNTPAIINNTERHSNQYRPVAQGSTFNDLGENEEQKQPVATLKGSVNTQKPDDTLFSLKGAGVVSASTVRDRLGRVIELMSTKAGQGDYNGVYFLLKDLTYYTQANQEVSDILGRK
jgi:hypothetical protein